MSQDHRLTCTCTGTLQVQVQVQVQVHVEAHVPTVSRKDLLSYILQYSNI